MADSMPSQSTPETFHQFNWLPHELRNDIWSLAIGSTSQILEFNFQMAAQQSPETPEDVLHISAPPRSIPAVFHTCQESRSIAFAEYAEGYNLPDNRSLHPPGSTPCQVVTRLAERNAHLYWNPSRDIIVLRPGAPRIMACGVGSVCRTLPADFRLSFDKRTRYLVLDHESYTQGNDGWGSTVWLTNWIDTMTDLEVLFLRIAGQEWSRILAQFDGVRPNNDNELLRTLKEESILSFKESVLDQWLFFMVCINHFIKTRQPRPKPVQMVLVEGNEEIFRMLDSGIYS